MLLQEVNIHYRGNELRSWRNNIFPLDLANQLLFAWVNINQKENFK